MESGKLESLANEMRADILRMIGKAGSGHPGGSLSAIDILCALYFGGVMEFDPKDPTSPDRDRFVLAKGHAAPALYATLAHAGFFPRSELASLRKFGSRLQGHPDSTLLPGVEVSTGSLGQGLSIACGIACGLGLEGNGHSVFALLGDGECQEGQVWEAAMFAAHRNLDSVVAIIDRNGLQIDGQTCDVCDPGDIGQKFQAFGWDVRTVDGHDIPALVDVLEAARSERAGKPHAIIARTVKGKGVSFMENEAGWHGKAPSDDELARALAELGAAAAEPFWDVFDSVDPASAFGAHAADEAAPASAKGTVVRMATAEERAVKRATRAAYGATLAKLAADGLPIVAVDADLTGSTTIKAFAASSDENAERVFNVGIAEQNMTDVAAGLSLTGNIAFTGSFAVFGTGRAYDQIRNTICYSNLNVKVAPTHAGISVGPDGGSHQMLEDIALMRSLPRMRVLVPADYAAACSAIEIAARTPGPVYVRMGRASVPAVYGDGVELELGRAYVLRPGTDATIIACGIEVNEALRAADALEAKGISAEVIDAFSVVPLDEATILESLGRTGCAVVAEEHSAAGGLGAAVAELCAERHPVPLAFAAMRGSFGKSGSFEELAAHFGLDAAAIVEAVEKTVARKAL